MKETPSKTPYLAVLLLCVPVALAAHFLAYAGSHSLASWDFRAFYTAGKMMLAHARLYDLSQQWAFQKMLWPELTKPSQLLYIPYPPYDIVPMALVALWPLHTAYAIWMSVQTLVLSVLCYLLINSSEKLSPLSRLVLLVGCLTFLPVVMTLLQGQLSFMLALAVFMAWRNFKSGRDMKGGFWLSLLLIKFQFAFIPLLLLLFLRRWHALRGLLTGSVLLLVISLYLVGPSGLLDYIRLLASASQWGEAHGIHPQAMHSWRSFLYHTLHTNGGLAVQIGWLLGLAATLGLMAYSWRNGWKPQTERFDLLWALTLVAITFCSPHTNTHDLCLLLPAGVLIFYAANSSDTIARNARLALMALPVLGWLIVWSWFATTSNPPGITALTVLSQLLAMVFLARYCRKVAISPERA